MSLIPLKPGDRVRTVDGFGSPYLAGDIVYVVGAVEPDDTIRLRGREGAWPRLSCCFRQTDEPDPMPGLLRSLGFHEAAKAYEKGGE